MRYLGPLDAGGDLRDRSPEQLIRLFEARHRPGRFVTTYLLRSALLQVARQNREARDRGDPPAFEGHLRSLWHAVVEPLLARLPPDLPPKNPYKLLVKTLGKLVFQDRLLRYSDLRLTDRSFEDRRIGTSRPAILVVAEKRGLFRVLRRVHERTGVTVWATAGFPSGVGSEITAADVLAATGGASEIDLLVVADYGPAGFDIARALRRHLTHFGLSVRSTTRLFRPELVPEPLRERAARPIPTAGRRGAIIARWLEATGGLDGRPLRLNVETLEPDRLEALIVDAVEALDAPT